MKFNRWEPQSSGEFAFLGFDFYWGQSRRNPKHWRVRRTTNAKKLRAGLASLKDWVKKSRSTPLRDLIPTLRRKLQGHWNYYGVIGNSKQLSTFAHFARRLVSDRGGLFLFGPFLWGWIVFIFGLAGLAVYWAIHHSSLRASAPPQAR